ncbi:ATP-binding protein [Maricaulis sp.]|uniref:ATP-binding protein n=1 Tax=Maricaulis sp. TaxID=1486257 RepID=UPI00262E0103|nr:ATP-binding protein [Maricaulis sp.]
MNAKALTLRYIIALSLIAVMATALLGLSLVSSHAGSEDARLINEAGRQRMLSQRITMLVFEYHSGEITESEIPIRDRLDSAITTFLTSHQRLMMAAADSPYISAIYTEGPHALDPLSHQFVVDARAAMESRGSRDMSVLLAQEAELILPLLNDATNAFEQAANDRAAHLERLEWVAYIITLIVLMLEAFLIFRRAAASVQRSMRKMRLARIDAEKANATKSTFLAQMSHEIRTPLNGVLGMAAALDATKLDDDQKRMVTTISASGDLLLAVVNDVLDLSKIEADQVGLEEIDMSVEQILNWVDSAFRPAAVAKGLKLDVKIEEQARGWYKGDPTRMRQILSNLVSNAIKFTDEGGVTARARVLSKRASGEHLLELSVSDTGVGIPTDRLAAIFDPFEQADASTTRTHGGTGLGLAISKRLADMMGGKVTVTSFEGEGSTFTVTLKLPQGEAPVVHKERKLQVVEGRRRLRVLVVDDVSTNRLVLESLLAQCDVDTVSAGSGQEAINITSKEGFDLILMDVQMPDMDGIETTKRIRSREAAKAMSPTPIIACTANVMPEQINAYLAAGLDRHLPKPVRKPDLEALIESYRAPQEADAETGRKSA